MVCCGNGRPQPGSQHVLGRGGVVLNGPARTQPALHRGTEGLCLCFTGPAVFCMHIYVPWKWMREYSLRAALQGL